MSGALDEVTHYLLAMIGFTYSVSVAYYPLTHHLFLLPAPTPCIYSLIFFIDQSTYEFYRSTPSLVSWELDISMVGSRLSLSYIASLKPRSLYFAFNLFIRVWFYISRACFSIGSSPLQGGCAMTILICPLRQRRDWYRIEVAEPGVESDIVQQDANDMLGGNREASTQKLSIGQWVC